MSAHRTPDHLFRYAETAEGRGIRVIVAGAGGAAHLPGMLASKTLLPVIGVPIPTQHLGGLDSLLSIVQMPRGIPVATVAIGNAENAALLAAAILALSDEALAARLAAYRAAQTAAVLGDESNVGSPDNLGGLYPNFVKIAEGFGVKGRRVHKKSELKAAIQEMLDHDGPYVLDVIVPYTEHVLPMIPAGRTVKDMLLK